MAKDNIPCIPIVLAQSALQKTIYRVYQYFRSSQFGKKQYTEYTDISGLVSMAKNNICYLWFNQHDEKQFFVNLLLGEPFILQPPYDIGVDIGMNISVPCVSYGFPRPQTSWYKKDDSLETNKRAKIGEDGTLFIRDLQVEDEGTYVCVVENQFGKEEVSAYLRITGI
ncbi:muscle, skeletal receptor tyrosine-protein kinase-like, partial [Saccoglossus kowalevskii]